MTVPIEREEGAVTMRDAEPCAWCARPTLSWTALPDREPGEQVALCAVCADQIAPVDVPAKRAWFERWRAEATR